MLLLMNDVLVITHVFEKYKALCKSSYSNNPLYSYGTQSFTREAGFEMTGRNLDSITDDKLRLLLENILPGGPSAVNGNRHVKRE